jgi:hypothetical protein
VPIRGEGTVLAIRPCPEIGPQAPGERVVTGTARGSRATSETGRVESLERIAGAEAVYDLEVHRSHTFYVGADAVPVHNGKKCGREHTKNARPSTKDKHEKGQAASNRSRGGEKGDESRDPPRKRPDGHKGPWPPERSVSP